MTRLTLPGASYTDALPGGQYCALFFGQRIETHLGTIDLPPGEDGPLFLRCTNVGGFKFAGQAHASNGTYEWRVSDGWRFLGPPCCGVNPVIYDRAGVLHASDCSIGSQGYRYVSEDGQLVTGDQTYGSAFGLSEWSAYGGLFIGQGHDLGGCLVWDGSALRVLETGDCRFIRVQGAGDRVAVSFVTPTGAVIVWTTLAELRSLPVAGMPPPTPIDPPKPTPEPPPMNLIAPNLIELIRQTMREHPEINKLDENQRGRILDYAAAKAGPSWGRKSRNAQGTDLNSDAFCFLRPDGLFEIYDVISGGDGSATWDGYGPYRQGENGYWVKALPVTDTPPTPQPPPTPSVDVVTRAQMDTAIHAAIMDLHQALLNEVDHSVGDRIADLKEELRHQPVETDQLVELLKRVTVTGKTRTSFGHQHQVDLGLTLKP